MNFPLVYRYERYTGINDIPVYWDERYAGILVWTVYRYTGMKRLSVYWYERFTGILVWVVYHAVIWYERVNCILLWTGKLYTGMNGIPVCWYELYTAMNSIPVWTVYRYAGIPLETLSVEKWRKEYKSFSESTYS